MKETYFKCFQTSLLFFQGCLFFPLIHSRQRHASVGEGRDRTGERARPERTKEQPPNSGFFFSVDNCYAAKTLSTGILTFLKIIKIKHTCLLLLNLWLSSPLERPSAAPGHPVSCWGPGVNVSHTLHLMSPKCHFSFLFFFLRRRINIKACQDCTNRATPQYADGERKGLNTYTNCKLKMEQ